MSNQSVDPRGPFDYVPTTKPFDTVGFIIEFENGGLDEGKIIEGFQHLIDTGLVWSLQGSYDRAAESLISQGLCTSSNPKSFNLCR